MITLSVSVPSRAAVRNDRIAWATMTTNRLDLYSNDQYDLSTFAPTGGHRRTIGDCVTNDDYGRTFACSGWAHLSFSNDGRRMAWSTANANDHGGELVVAAGDGSAPHVVGHIGELDVLGSLSPDGNRLAYVRLQAPGPGGAGASLGAILTSNVDGGGVRVLYRGSDGRAPAWTPNGRRLLFTRGNTIWSMTLGGTDLRRVARGSLPVPSRDGRHFAYLSNGAIFVAALDGHGARRVPLRGLSGTVDETVFAPDGKRLAFAEGCDSSDGQGPAECLYTVSLGGGRPRRVAQTAGGYFPPDELGLAWRAQR